MRRLIALAALVADTTTEIDPYVKTSVALVNSGGNHFYWQ